jgi:S-adenosylmethionine decarboxylase
MTSLRAPPNPRTQSGRHWVADLLECRCIPALLLHVEPLRALCVDAVKASGLTMVGESFHQFVPAGATGVVVLAESHLAVHTWPEIGFVTVDLYVCNVVSDNSEKGARLFEQLVRTFDPTQARQRQVERGV